MKRFLKKKIVDTENIRSPACLSIESGPARECDMPITRSNESAVQPPLPQYPPPPDSPPSLDIVKQEVEDDSYETPASTSEAENASLQIDSPATQGSPKQQKFVMCKDFIRGTCIRKQCRYTHVTDVSQLEGVYTFCWNYQNTGCYKPNCKYVHANPFEEGEFYRTGYLPPRALAHIKKQNILPPPPPPPKEAPLKLPIFANPPPPLCNSSETPEPVAAAAAAAAAAEPSSSTSPRASNNLKREWSKVEDASSSSDEAEPKAKCKYCVDMEFRLQYNKDNVEKMIRSSKKFEEKMRAAERKQHKLNSVLATLLKPNNFLEQLSALLDAGSGNL